MSTQTYGAERRVRLAEQALLEANRKLARVQGAGAIARGRQHETEFWAAQIEVRGAEAALRKARAALRESMAQESGNAF